MFSKVLLIVHSLHQILQQELLCPVRRKNMNSFIAQSISVPNEVVRKIRKSAKYRRCFQTASNVKFLAQFDTSAPLHQEPVLSTTNQDTASMFDSLESEFLLKALDNDITKFLHFSSAEFDALVNNTTSIDIKSKLISEEYKHWLTKHFGNPMIAKKPKQQKGPPTQPLTKKQRCIFCEKVHLSMPGINAKPQGEIS